MKSAKRVLLLFILISTFGISLFYGNIIKIMTVNYSDFTKLSTTCYVENNIPKDTHTKLQSLVENAKERIAQKFGTYTAQPIIIFTKSNPTTKQYGGNPFGVTYTLPWNQYVIIGPKGDNIDIIAHELLHAEIANRLGYLTYMLKLPTWIDEGIVMQVDYRQKYTIDLASITEQEINKVKALSQHQFSAADRNTVIKHYQISKALITQILNQYPKKHLFTMFNQVKSGKSFEDVFHLKKSHESTHNGKPTKI